MFFALASIVAKWALDNGEFSDIEGAKFEMLEDQILGTKLMMKENKILMNKPLDEMSPANEAGANGLPTGITSAYNDEYKVGHNRPPMFLIVLYLLVLAWAAISWIPFYGY